jgi:hypothetical protein
MPSDQTLFEQKPPTYEEAARENVYGLCCSAFSELANRYRDHYDWPVPVTGFWEPASERGGVNLATQAGRFWMWGARRNANHTQVQINPPDNSRQVLVAIAKILRCCQCPPEPISPNDSKF